MANKKVIIALFCCFLFFIGKTYSTTLCSMRVQDSITREYKIVKIRCINSWKKPNFMQKQKVKKLPIIGRSLIEDFWAIMDTAKKGKLYIIYVEDILDTTWHSSHMILSLKEKIQKKDKKKYTKLRIGKTYKMILTPYFSMPIYNLLESCPDIKINEVQIIIPHRLWTSSNIDTTSNIKDLYYIPFSNNTSP